MDMELKDLIIYRRTLPKRRADYAPLPEGLAPELEEYLQSSGIKSLYTHQAEMFTEAEQGKHIVITTSTASGKTLSFLLPVLQNILAHPTSRAIFLYPTKALASDQYRALQPVLKAVGGGRIQAGVYDGDTPASERTRIRKHANLILTNPEMLNGAFLPNHSRYGFDFIFSNLAYVVIDELHTYRGVFGSHVANLFRRLNRVCGYYHADPQFLCSSATIANPVELAEKICGKPFVQIDRDGSPSPERSYLLVQPPRIEGNEKQFYGQVQATSIAADMIPELVEENHSFLAFAKSRRNVEVVLREARDKMDAAGFLGHSQSGQISGYRGGYTPLERKTIEKKMISGELKGLVSTNALELGIDIGKIDTTILIGYPGTRASFWQQTGRAGRSGQECRNYMILESLPFDQYIGVNPGWLFDHKSEFAVLDPNNLLIELAHIRAAAAELPLTLNDIALFPDLGESIPVLLRVGELNSQHGKFAWAGNAFPAGDFSLRNMDQKRYKLLDQETHREITEMDELQAFREIHDGAIYLHDGNQYQVVRLDLETRTAYAQPYQGNYYTMPTGTTELKIIHQQERQDFGRTAASWGDVNVDESVYLFKKLQFHNHQNLGYESLNQPLSKDYDTEGMWLAIPDAVVRVFRSLLQMDGSGQLVRNNHFDGMCHAIKTAARLVTMTEQEDIGVSMSGNAIGLDLEPGSEVNLFLYDKFVGGLGYAEKAYQRFNEIWEAAVKLVEGCSCKDGCAACVGDYKLDRAVVLWGLRSLKEELAPPEGFKYVNTAKRSSIQKAFRFEELPERWPEFCSYMQGTGDSLANFFSAIPQVVFRQDELVLYTESSFYRDWILEENNKRSLKNIFQFYTECSGPVRFSVQVDEAMKEAENQSAETELKQKLQRRYEAIKRKE